MLRLTPRPQKAPRPIPENVAYTLGSVSRAVARLCATPNKNRVTLVNLVDEMETREQQLLHTTSLLRPTLKNLHNFMVGRMAGEAENQAFYAYDTQNVHQSVLRHLTDSLA